VEFVSYQFAFHFTRGVEFSLLLHCNILYMQSFHCECMSLTVKENSILIIAFVLDSFKITIHSTSPQH